MSEEEKKHPYEDEFVDVCAALVVEGVEKVLKQLTDEQLMNTGRAVVREFVRASILTYVARVTYNTPALFSAESAGCFTSALLRDGGVENLDSVPLDASEVNKILTSISKAAAAQKAGTDDDCREFAEGEYLPTDEDAGQVMFSAEDPAAAEGACETEGGAQ